MMHLERLTKLGRDSVHNLAGLHQGQIGHRYFLGFDHRDNSFVLLHLFGFRWVVGTNSTAIASLAA